MAEPSVEDDATSTKESSEAAAADASSGNAAKIAVVLLAAFMLFFGITIGYLVASGKEAAETETSSTENKTAATEPVTTTTPPPTTTNQSTTTLPPYYGPKVLCFYDLTTLGSMADSFAWVGVEVCHDVHVRVPLLLNGAVTQDFAYQKLDHPEDRTYLMYLWDEIYDKNLRYVKARSNNKNRRYSLGWLNTTHLPLVTKLQVFVDVFKSGTTAEDSGIALGINLNEDKFQQSREQLFSLIGGVSPKFTVLIIKLEDPDAKACQIFPFWKNNKIKELLKLEEIPANVALPVTAAVYRASRNDSDGSCVTFEKADRTVESWCARPTEDIVFKAGRHVFGAENNNTLGELKKKYHAWRAANICVLNMEYLYFFEDCIVRNATDFIL